MSDFIRIYCRHSADVTQGEVAQFILDGVFFEEPPEFDPSDALDRGTAEWESLKVFYDADRRPIIIWRTADGALLSDEVYEAKEALSSIHDQSNLALPDLSQRLEQTSMIYAFEVNASNLTDEAWQALDALEAYLAHRGDGIVYAPSDGFFDAGLARIVNLP